MAEAEVVTPQVDTPEPAVVPDTPPVPQEIDAPKYTQKQLDEIVGKVKENQRRRRDELRRDLDVFKRMALEKQATPQAPQPAQTQVPDARPKQENFTDYNEYLEALADWKADNKVKEYDAKRKQDDEKTRRQQDLQQAQRAYAQHEAKARAKYDDYDTVALASDLPINEAMAYVILMSGETGPDIAHYLGTHRDEAARIASLHPALAAKELGKIEARFSAAPTPKEPSAAPAPITPVVGRSAVASDEPSENDDTATWIRKRQKQVHGTRRR